MTQPRTQLGTGVPPSTVERELAVEQAHVDLVYGRLDEATRSAQQLAREGRSLYQSDRANFVREEDGTGLYERDVFAFQAARRLAVLDAEHEGLVFGRLDRGTGETRYVGRIGVRDADYEPLVIDWRAPAAEAFYRATASNPMGVVRRRVLRCQGVRVVGIEDDLLDTEHDQPELVVVGEGALMAALTRARGHTMRDIVATIQAEQDEAIRAPYPGFTLISGGPGTGKTVVALHRAAYLLYSNRRRFENGGVLVVGPSRVFMNYIERVLPSLGEESVTLRAIGAVASDVVRVSADRVDSAPAAGVKGSLRMVRLLKRLVAEPPHAVPLELRLTLKGHVLILAPDVLAPLRSEVLAHHKLNQGREAASRALLAALWQRCPEDLDLERDDFDDQVSETAAFKMFLHAWWPTVTATAMLARLADPRLMARVAGGTLTPGEQERLSASYRSPNGRVSGNGHHPIPAEPAWTIADVALLDELVNLLGPVPDPEEREVPLFLDDDATVSEVVTTMDRLEPRSDPDLFGSPHETYAHILVDEAQDITPMQWRMLRRRGGGASWTIVGDSAQSSWPDAAEYERAMTELIGTAPVRRFRLSTNYRSPAEVFDLAASVVVREFPEADLPKAVRSTGVQPELRAVPRGQLNDELGSVAAGLLDEVAGTVGVLVPPSRADQVAQALQLQGLGGTDRLVVATPLDSKGLEYDGVLVVAPDEIVAESPGGVRALYVALTRATQRLVTLDLSRPGGAPTGAWRKSLG